MITTGTVEMIMGRRMEKTLPGLGDVYMCGQWVEPGGGVSTAAGSGKTVIQTICGKDKKKFCVSLPAESSLGEKRFPVLSLGKER